ncbi:MAG: hypothetical protein ACW99G_06125 [Candidatus Thorarchaeota archaeon]|jgi:hypothetical protein
MKHQFLLTLLVTVLAFGAGFLIGEKREQSKYEHFFEGSGWQLRWKADTPPPVNPIIKEDKDTHVRVWPFIDIHTKK